MATFSKIVAGFAGFTYNGGATAEQLEKRRMDAAEEKAVQAEQMLTTSRSPFNEQTEKWLPVEFWSTFAQPSVYEEFQMMRSKMSDMNETPESRDDIIGMCRTI